MRGEAMLPHPYPNLLPKVDVKTVLVSSSRPSHPAMVLMVGRPVSVHHS